MSSDNVDYGAAADDRVERVRLTATGRQALQELVSTVPERDELPVVFDRMCWHVAARDKSELLRPREARTQGLRELPANMARKATVDDIQIELLNRMLAKARSWRGMVPKQVLALKGVSRVEQWYLPAVLLVYRTRTGDDVELAVAIDGHLSPAHEQALNKAGGPERLGIRAAEADDDGAQPLPPEVRDQRVPLDVVTDLHRQLSEAEQVLRGPARREAADDEVAAPPGEAPAAPAVVEERRREAAQALDAMQVRSITVFEHREFLGQALTRSRRRLLIIAPWITREVVDREFVSRLEALLRRKGFVAHLAYGLGRPEDDTRSDRRAVDDLKHLAGRYKNLTFKRLNTHAKVLIWDNAWINTSFNWFSFRGDPRRAYRMEEGTLVRVPEIVEREHQKYAALIDAA
jgi:hypothetical protein